MARKTLTKGDTVTIKDRLWGIVDASSGMLVTKGWRPAIYHARQDAYHDKVTGERIIRLSDITGTVV